VARLFVGNATERGIPTVLAPGESLHIDWVNATAQDPEALIVSASKSYLDWYMLTQARFDFTRVAANRATNAGLRVRARVRITCRVGVKTRVRVKIRARGMVRVWGSGYNTHNRRPSHCFPSLTRSLRAKLAS